MNKRHIPKAVRAVGYVVSALIIPPFPGVVVAGLFLMWGDRQAAKRAAIVTAVAFFIVTMAIIGKNSEAQAASYKQCHGVTYGDNFQFYNITTRNVSCATARRTARSWELLAFEGPGVTYLRDFDCRARQTGYTMDVRCTAGRKVVHFHVTAED